MEGNEQKDEVVKEVRDLDVNSMTPLEALQKLNELKRKAGEKEDR